jgi:L-ascorbate metabolism protein UlaG (beta-lactamase superfamily)
MNGLKTITVGVAAAAVCLSTLDNARAQTAYLQQSNADHMRQLATTDCTKDGEVTLDYYGFMAFVITSPCGLRGMFDPWRDAKPGLYNPETGDYGGWDKVTWMEHKFPRLLTDPKHSMVDYAATTHAHFDHDGVYQFDSAVVLDRLAGGWQFADVKITGLVDFHACGADGMYPWNPTGIQWIGVSTCTPGGPTEYDNVVYYVDLGKDKKISIVHWGDNKFDLLPQNKEFFRTHPVDIAIIPVDDSGHIVRPEEIADIVKQIRPKVIIPSHYFIKGIVNPSYTVLTADRWFAAQKHRHLTKAAQAKITREWLDGLKLGEGEFLAMYFEDNVSFPVIDVPADWEAQLQKSKDALAKVKQALQ